MGVTLLACGVLILAGYQLTRLLAAILHWQTLAELYLPGSLGYLAINGAAWFLFWLPAGYGLWTGKPWAGWTFMSLAPVYILQHWLERLYQLESAGSLGTNWFFTVIVSILALVLPYLVLHRPSSKLFFRSNP